MTQFDSEIRLLSSSSADAEALADLRVFAMRESLERIGRFDESRARNRLLSSFAAEFTRHVEVDGERVGFVVLTPHPNHLSLDHFYVHPDYQSTGTGSAVLDLLFAEADHVGKNIRVGALKGSNSNRFYTRHGFELVEADEFDNYFIRRASATK